MKKIWLGIGAIVIIILLLLQTRFTEFLRLDNSGYAVETGKVKQLLLADPNEEEFVGEDVPLTAFEALEYVYQRGNSYYLGEKKKTEIDMDFPMLISDGAGILFTDNESILFDVEFEEYETYRGLMMSDKVAYNPGGERADANEYLFAQMSNGLYTNLTPMTFEDNGELREVTMNSFICFRENYFTYMEPVNGISVYQRCNRIAEDDIITINEEEYTYRELLLLLNALSERKEKTYPTVSPEVPEVEIPEIEVAGKEETVPDTLVEEIEESEEEEEEAEAEEEEDDTKQKEKKKSTSKRTSTAKKNPSKKSSSSKGSSKGSKQQGSMGVRPDSARPDKVTGDKAEKPVENYVKPTVTVHDIRAGVYRVMVDVSVDDPAARLNTLRKVQFEFYEVADDGETETLVYRTYTGAGSNKTVEGGNGAIKPDTTYRVNVYYTYYDEYNQSIVEPLLDLPGGGLITTKPRSELGKVVFKTGTEGGINYMDIPYYYDNKLVLTSVAYDPALSDPEAVYAIDNAAGLTIDIKGVTDPGFQINSKVENMALGNIKRGVLTDVSSTSALKPNSSYEYTIKAIDFGGDSIELKNHEGNFDTCKARPQATLSIDKNEIANFEIDAAMIDPENSAIPAEGSSDYDVYLVIATKQYNMPGGFTWEDCEDYLANGRTFADEENGVEEGKVHYVYKFAANEIVKNGKIDLSQKVSIDSLDLNTKYNAYLLADFDLNNKRGPQRHEEVAYLKFTSASLSSLGNIYVKVDIADINAHSAIIDFSLNDTRTNKVLTELLSSVTFNITPIGGENPDAFITFNSDDMTHFTGWYVDSNGDRVRNENLLMSIRMDEDCFDETLGGHPLTSMTEYQIVPDIKATYPATNGKEYDMKVVLTTSKFKTMREPAKVIIENDLFAAGTLRFNVKVEDPDNAITGNSGHVVVMNVYDSNRNFIKAVRIPKNTEDFIYQEIKGLDPAKKYFLNFVAVEYNEGYSNATFESNKVIYTHMVDQSLDISGTLKLQNMEAGIQKNELVANTKVTINDPTRILNKELPYYISIEKNGVNITDSYGSNKTCIIDYEYDARHVITKDHPYTVEKGKNTYKMTLYIKYNGNDLILDTLTFNSEDVVIGISSAQQFMQVMKDTGGKGRFVITDNIDLGTTNTIYNVNGKDVKPTAVVGNFNGQIDFQGYELSINKMGDVAGIFTNIGPDGEVSNAVFNFKSENGTRVYDDGILCNYNYGHIHDVIVNYKGGSNVANQYYGLLCRVNASSGLIERFVINNDPEEGLFPFVADYEAGLVAASNVGTIRDGYVYGEDIYGAPSKSRGGALNLGGIVGNNGTVGKLENVFSLVNVMVSPPMDAGKANTQYGSVSGVANGSISNAYSVGQSKYTVTDLPSGEAYDVDGIGPALGTNNSTNRNIYYWNEQQKSYVNGKYQELISLESLHDYNWQKGVLDSAFDVQPVEVGFYPQVIMSGELPEQELIPLPERSYANLIEIMSATVLSYAEDGNSAEVEFRISNTRNVFVEEITIDGLTVVLDHNSATSADGYTTIIGTVSEPTKFVSAYEITGAKCQYNSRTQTVEFTPAPLLMVDFYRDIHNADEWYEYVVKKPTENARLANDIDFAGVQPKYIRVTSNYTGKLNGGKKDGCTYGYSLKKINFSSEKDAFVFSALYGEINGVVVEDLNLGTAKTQTQDTTGFVRNLYGNVKNVHMKGVEIGGTDYIGSLVSYARSGSVIQDCTASGVTITYRELPNTNTTATVGGLVGCLYEARMENCYARDVNITATDLRGSRGIGGVIGYAYSAVIDSAYATGDITARSMDVGGIVGQYVSGRARACIKNVIARVNVTCNQNAVGGLVGEMRLTESPLTEQTNMTGIAFGNVFCSNTDSEDVSYTVGYMSGHRGTFYGTDFQLLNGIVGAQKDKNTYGLLTYEQTMDASVYTDGSLLNMENCYDYSMVEDGFMPKLYYADQSGLLPFQETDQHISLVKVANNLLQVTAIDVDKVDRTIWMDVAGPAGYTITGVSIPQLKYEETLNGILTIPENGTARVVVKYLQETQQEHFLDSYNLVEISYRKADSSEIGRSDFSENPIRVPLTLFKDIHNIQTWNEAFKEENNCGNYENYRVSQDIDFGTQESYFTNAKVGRLVGVVTGNEGQRANLTNIQIKKNNENLIFRLNSELSNINFTDCSVETAGRDNVGLIGTSAGRIYDVNFENISIENKSATRNYVGIIGYQQGGTIGEYDETDPEKGKIVARNISVGQQYGLVGYAGGITGYATMETSFANIEAENIKVRGTTRLGGIIGASGKISIDGINAKDITVIGTTEGRVGGILGAGSTGYTSTNSAYMKNITLTGTPVYDESGNIISSSTTIGIDEAKAATNAIYVGGVFGYLEAYGTGHSGTSVNNKEPIYVNGIVVQGYGNYVGGIGGYLNAINNATIENSLITTVKAPTAGMAYVGGIGGRNAYNNYYNKVVNCQVKPTNFSYAGLVFGYQASSSMYYAQAENSSLIAKNTLANGAERLYYGGIVGYNVASTNYCTVYNCTIDASDGNMSRVGGVVGHSQGNVDRCFYYAEPAGTDKPTADAKYYVRGKNLVGGLAGENYYASGSVTRSYSNANVIATGNYAGGLLGAYENGYSKTTLNGSPRFTYAGCSMKNNYFAGTVSAGDYAGGLIGRLGMAYGDKVAANHKELGGRNASTEIEGGKSGSSYESAYTTYNLMLAESVKSAGDHVYAFAGNYDGFEGKANYNYNGNSAGADDTTKDKAIYTYMYAGTTLNDVELDDMKNAGETGSYEVAPEGARNGGTYRYKRFGDYSNDDTGVANRANVRILLPDDLEYIFTTDGDGVKRGGYRGMKWFIYQNGQSGRDANGDMRGDLFRLITKDVNYSKANMGADDTAFYKGYAYLPHARINSAASAISDWLTKYQSTMRMALPVPQGTFEERVETASTRTMSLRARPIQTYGVLYQSDVDKITVEFSEDLLSGGYFILYCGGEIVDHQLINKRAYSYTYDYQEDLKLCYGYVDQDLYIELMEEEGLVYGDDFMLDDIFTPHIRQEEYMIELNATEYENRALEHHIMTYGEKYYYIDDQGIWSGTGSSASVEETEEESESREDASATLLSGDFVTLYNGKALKSNGDVVNAETGEKLRSVASGVNFIEDKAIPLQVFVPEGVDDVTVETYSRFCEIISGDGIVVREDQYLQSALGVGNIIDGSLPNVKDAVVQYVKKDYVHCTILGSDGIMYDMHSKEDINAPEDFRSSGIVSMTNNFNCTAPFILVEYQNGGIVGYNYMTGEYLFDHSIANVMGLLDYAKVYFTGDKSELANISSTYAANAKLAEIAGTSERLTSMITGVSEGSEDENNTGENTLKTKNPDTAQKAENGEVTTNVTTDTSYDDYAAGTDKEGTKDIEKDAGGNGESSANVTNTVGLSALTEDGDVNTTGGKGNDSGNENTPTNTVEGDSTASGTGDGDGVNIAQGQVTASGTGSSEHGEGNDETEGTKKLDLSDESDLDDEDTEDEGDEKDAEAEDTEEGEGTGEGEGDGEGDGDGTKKDEVASKDTKEGEGESKATKETEGEDVKDIGDGDTKEGEGENNGDGTSSGLPAQGTTLVSTAGTQVTIPSSSASNSNGTTSDIVSSNNQSSSNTGTGEGRQAELITVYNHSTGTYEIVDKGQYLTNQNYYSENQKLNIQNLSSVYSGFAAKEPEKKQANGLGLYVFVTLCALGGIGGTIWYRKKHKMKF